MFVYNYNDEMLLIISKNSKTNSFTNSDAVRLIVLQIMMEICHLTSNSEAMLPDGPEKLIKGIYLDPSHQ